MHQGAAVQLEFEFVFTLEYRWNLVAIFPHSLQMKLQSGGEFLFNTFERGCRGHASGSFVTTRAVIPIPSD